jgi:hypothetical protein
MLKKDWAKIRFFQTSPPFGKMAQSETMFILIADIIKIHRMKTAIKIN